MTCDTSPSSTTLSKAALTAACAAGPLKQFLAGLSTSDFNGLDASAQSGAIDVIVYSRTPGGVFGFTFGGGNAQFLSGSVAAAGIVELRFVPSADR